MNSTPPFWDLSRESWDARSEPLPDQKLVINLNLINDLICNATYRWVESEARRVLREVLNAREKERRQEVTPPVARTRRARGEVSDDDEGDDGDDANRVGAGAAA